MEASYNTLFCTVNRAVSFFYRTTRAATEIRMDGQIRP